MWSNWRSKASGFCETRLARAAYKYLEDIMKFRTLLILSLFLFSTAACNLTTVPPNQGTGVTITIPPGLASSAQSEIVPESIGLDQPAWQIHPAYTHITL